MISLKFLKMKQVKDMLASKAAVKKARRELEHKTEKTFQEYARSKRKAQELAHMKYLD
jgi:hypothetical protein